MVQNGMVVGLQLQSLTPKRISSWKIHTESCFQSLWAVGSGCEQKEERMGRDRAQPHGQECREGLGYSLGGALPFYLLLFPMATEVG